ncbi:MAG: hypothetical protein LBN38_05665 [Verrucomicrobiota bacterium]|jgi:hypothetical protein|nr:hypothetical protein [Verrucomicrobiota bacterium]
MNKIASIFLFAALGAAGAGANEFHMDWAYHGVGDDARLSEQVPGEALHFLANASSRIPASDTVTLYILTDHDFAGDMEEQVYVRWWDGYMAHWIMGNWVKNVTVDPQERFHDLPSDGEVFLDLWEVKIPSWVTQPGENFYAIQLKGYANDTTEERYLLCRSGGDFSRTNQLGQVWSSSEEFDGQDWKVAIEPEPSPATP